MAFFLVWQERRIRRLRGELREVRQDQQKIERNLRERDTAAEIIRAANKSPVPQQRTGRRPHLRGINGGRALALALIGGAAALLTKYRDRTVATLAAVSATTAVGSTVVVFVPMDSEDEPTAEGSTSVTTVIQPMPAPSSFVLTMPPPVSVSGTAPTSAPSAEATASSIDSSAEAAAEDSERTPSVTATTKPDVNVPAGTASAEPSAEERAAVDSPETDPPASPDGDADDTSEAEQPPPPQRQPQCADRPAPVLCGLVADLGDVVRGVGELLLPTSES